MKLGIETASVVNSMMSNSNQAFENIEVGTGATILMWTDRKPATVIFIDKNVVGVQQDFAERVDNNGMSDCQDWKFSENKKGSVTYFRKRKDGTFEAVKKNKETGRWVKTGTSEKVRFGKREKFHDFSF